MWNGATWDVLSSACVFTPRRHVTVTLCRVRPMSIGQRGRGEFRLWRSNADRYCYRGIDIPARLVRLGRSPKYSTICPYHRFVIPE
jgi:hypothetical protein